MIPVLSVIAVVTILFGNITAVAQGNLKRLMGLSGIAHAGYLLLGVVAFAMGIAWAEAAVLFYLFTYLLGSFAVFGVMTSLLDPMMVTKKSVTMRTLPKSSLFSEAYWL